MKVFNNFKKSVSGGKVKITPKNEKAKEMLKIGEIGKYSTKMRSILKSISETKTEGIVFVYLLLILDSQKSYALYVA